MRTRYLSDRADKHNHFLAWGPGGDWIYFVHGTPATQRDGPVADSSLGRRSGTAHSTEQRHARPHAAGTRHVLYVAHDSDGSGPWIWALDITQKTSRRITFGLEKYTSLSASADGRRLAATVANPKGRAVDRSDSRLRGRGARREAFRLPSSRALTPRIRGNALYYLSSQGAGDGLWRFEDGKTAEIWRGTDGRMQPPAISADGRRIAIVTRKEGNAGCGCSRRMAQNPNSIAPEIDVEGSADWSPDGNWIVTGGNDGKGDGLFKVPTAGGAPVRTDAGVGPKPGMVAGWIFDCLFRSQRLHSSAGSRRAARMAALSRCRKFGLTAMASGCVFFLTGEAWCIWKDPRRTPGRTSGCST